MQPAAGHNDTVDLTHEDDNVVDVDDDDIQVLEEKLVQSNDCITIHISGPNVQQANQLQPHASSRHPLAKKRKRVLPDTPPPAPEPAVKKLKCPICLDLMTEKDKPLLSTKCGHIFCAVCLTDSLKVTKQCPTCRTKLTAKTMYHPIFL